VSKLTEAVLRSDVEAMKQAIASGDNLNEFDGGLTPLLWAIFRGDVDAVRLLLESGADPNVRPNPSDSPLWHAEDDFRIDRNCRIAEILRRDKVVCL